MQLYIFIFILIILGLVEVDKDIVCAKIEYIFDAHNNSMFG